MAWIETAYGTYINTDRIEEMKMITSGTIIAKTQTDEYPIVNCLSELNNEALERRHNKLLGIVNLMATRDVTRQYDIQNRCGGC